MPSYLCLQGGPSEASAHQAPDGSTSASPIVLLESPSSQSINRLKTVQNLLISRRRKNLRVLHLQLPCFLTTRPPQNKPAAFPDCRAADTGALNHVTEIFPCKIRHSGRDHLKIPHLIHIHTVITATEIATTAPSSRDRISTGSSYAS